MAMRTAFDGSARRRALSKIQRPLLIRPVRVKPAASAPIAGAVPTQTFADVLDDALQRPRPRLAAADVPIWPSRLTSRVRTPALPGAPLTTPAARWLAGETGAAPRPDHVMTTVQRLAFDRFTALGGALRGNFTAADLRREYRVLAQRYHPDRHLAADPLSRHAAASRFGEATACYRCLRALVLH